MSATGHELRRRRQAAERVMHALKGRDLKAFVRNEGLPCEPTTEALAVYLPRHDRVSLDAMAARLQQGSGKPPEPPEPMQAHRSAAAFDLRGNWMQKRAEVRDALGMDKVPGNKAEAAAALRAAGYEVKE